MNEVSGLGYSTAERNNKIRILQRRLNDRGQRPAETQADNNEVVRKS